MQISTDDYQRQTSRVDIAIMLGTMTVLFILSQIILFFIHNKVSELVDSLVNSSISSAFVLPIILVPIIIFLAIQIFAYVLFACWIWLSAISCAEVCKFSSGVTYRLAILLWFFACAIMFALNYYYFPDSFFSILMDKTPAFKYATLILMSLGVVALPVTSLIALINVIWFRRHCWIGGILILVGLSIGAAAAYNAFISMETSAPPPNAQPNIIFIGLDSVRPDFLSYFGKENISTPTVDEFLRSATTFTHTYTPLARTYPSWVSILTAKYPKHNFARNNLIDPIPVLQNVTFADRLRQAGYETIYATDEKRFSNITKAYGFDRVLGPTMGVDDFLLGGLTDFPLTNLMINLPIGKYLFPYNYGNRAEATTYKPNSFLQLVRSGLAQRSGKPLFLAIHLCVSHWPYTWARDGLRKNDYVPMQYRDSVEEVDAQLRDVMVILRKNHLLDNSLVVLLSDHGTTVGLPGDRLVSEKNYVGDPKKISLLSVQRLSSTPQNSVDFKHDYTINTSYGQGTDLLSLKQYHALMAFKFFGSHTFPVQWVNEDTSLMDIAPTVLDILHFAPMQQVDGQSLASHLSSQAPEATSPLPKSRPLFMETGDSMTEIETDHIYIEKVIKREIGIYRVNPTDGFLFMDHQAAESILKNKQFSILQGDWLLVRYPVHIQTKAMAVMKVKLPHMELKKFIMPSYYVLVNLSTGKWTVGLDSTLAKTAPVNDLLNQLKAFYGNEIEN